jgi:dihydroflavonol-4-reductase
MPVLVTGATGFVGSAVARALIARGESVRALARAGSDRRNLADLKIEIAEGDLTDRASLERAARGCEALYHVAADYRLWVPNPPEIYRANVDGSRALMEAAASAGVKRIVYTSSVATLGLIADGTPADEATPVTLADMIGHYKRSKFLAEEAVREMVVKQGLPAVIVNPSTPIGPRDIRPTPTGRMIVDAANGKIPAYLDTGLNVVHVDDVAAGHLAAFDRGKIGERYILGGRNMGLAEILAVIATMCGRKPPTIKLPRLAVLPIAYAVEAWARLAGTKGEPLITVDGVKLAAKRMFFSIAKAERELGYVARPAEAAIADALAWFRANGYCR